MVWRVLVFAASRKNHDFWSVFRSIVLTKEGVLYISTITGVRLLRRGKVGTGNMCYSSTIILLSSTPYFRDFSGSRTTATHSSYSKHSEILRTL